MKIQNLSPLFLIFLLLTTISLVPFASGATVIYMGFNWTSDGCTIPVTQSSIQGVEYPNMTFNNVFRPQSDTECLSINKVVDCFTITIDPCWYEGSFTIDYSAFSYAITTSASFNDNTSIIGESGTGGQNGLAFNTSFTHVANNQYALTWDRANAMGIFNYGNSVLGQLVPCEEFFLLNANEEIDFLFQMHNESNIDVWLGNATFPLQRWCNFNRITAFDGYRTGAMILGYFTDDGAGAGTGNILSSIRGVLQGFGCMTSFVHPVTTSIENLACGLPIGSGPIEDQGPGEPIPAPPNPFGVGNQTSFIILTVEDDKGNFRNQFANGETMVFDASLQFINDTSGLVQDAPIGSVINLFRFDEFFDAFTLVGSEPTVDRFNGLGPRARFPTVHIDDIVPTTDYRANYTGSFSANLTASISNEQTIITIDDAQIPLSIGTRLSPPSVEGTTLGPGVQGPLLASDIQRKELFNHGDNFRVSTFLTRIDTGAGLVDQTIFLELQINSTGPFIRLETITTNDVGRATSQFRTWDTRFIGAQVFRFRYFASAPFVNSSSVNATVFVSSQASDFRLTLEIIPSTVRPGDRIELRGQLTNIGSSSIGIPLSNRKIEIFVSSFDKTGFFNLQVTQNLALNIRTNDQGFYSHIIFGPNIGGVGLETMDFFSNSTINDIVATSPNATLTITVSTAPPTEIADVVPPNFFIFNSLIDNPQANCQFSEPKICSTMLWMMIVFIVSSVLAMVASGLKIPGELIGLGWLFMMLGGMTIGVFVQAVLEILLFILALPVVVVLFVTIGGILRGGSRGVTTA